MQLSVTKFQLRPIWFKGGDLVWESLRGTKSLFPWSIVDSAVTVQRWYEPWQTCSVSQFRAAQPREIRAPPAGEAEERQGVRQHCWRYWCGSPGASWWESPRGRTLSLATGGMGRRLKCHAVETNLCPLIVFAKYLDWGHETCRAVVSSGL